MSELKIGLDYTKKQVQEFHSAFNHPVSNSPKPLELDRAVNRAIWTGEEVLIEFIHQSSNNQTEFMEACEKLFTGLSKAIDKSLDMEYPKNDLEKIIGQSDALVDGSYFIAGTFVETGVEPQPLFDIVQCANMAKLGGDGKPIVRESDGKIMKPEGWEAPELKLAEEIKKQISK